MSDLAWDAMMVTNLGYFFDNLLVKMVLLTNSVGEDAANR